MEGNTLKTAVGEEEPVLYNFGPYGYVRYQCPFDRQPMENQTRSFSHFGVGTFRCLGGHEWKHDADRKWSPIQEGEVWETGPEGLRVVGVGGGHAVSLFALDTDEDIPGIVEKFRFEPQAAS